LYFHININISIRGLYNPHMRNSSKVLVDILPSLKEGDSYDIL
jgi:hypothetical protein